MKYSGYVMDYRDHVEFEERKKAGNLPPLIISAAITGGVVGKEANPFLPETCEEQIEATYEAYKAGASLVHIHARDPKRGYAVSSSNHEDYLKVNKGVREACPDIIINNTTGAGFDLTIEERMASLDAKPEVASLNCGPIIAKATLAARKPPLCGRDEPVCVDDKIISFTFKDMEVLAQAMRDRGVKPEFEVYNAQQVNVVQSLIQQGLVEKPYWFSAIFSTYIGGVGVPGSIRNYVNLMDNLPKNSIFQTIGVGAAQITMATLAVVTGAHVRVGMEDNLFYRRGELLKSNAQMVEKTVRLAEELEREVATPSQAREMLGLSQEPSTY